MDTKPSKKKPEEKPVLSVEHQFLAENVRRRRVMRGVSSREELALAAGVPLEAVEFAEKGPHEERGQPSIDDLRKILRFLEYQDQEQEALMVNVAERVLAGEMVFELRFGGDHMKKLVQS